MLEVGWKIEVIVTKSSCLKLLKRWHLSRKWVVFSTAPQAHNGLSIIFLEKKDVDLENNNFFLIEHDKSAQVYEGKSSETDSIKFKISSTSWEEGTAQKDITIDTTSDSQVNSNFPNKWSLASLTFNNYFYLFLYNVNNHK